MMALPLLVSAQQRQITGQVTTETGQPLPAASIMIKGSRTGVTADESGHFSITIPNRDAVLVISAAGYRETELRIGSADSYNVSLRPGDDLSTVVVTALGIRKEKRALGYAAQEVKGDELSATKQTNIVNALRGKVAGVQINSGGGAPGQGSHIVIRGVKSLSPGKNNQPLFVIDGIVIDNSTTTVSTAGELRGLSNRAA
ncbi:MAG TPA: carboxypeptidase-like regulatory domain-containing protein, partial [Chitinophagaceae bacterium]|nr:carboxypeptidase-like regulatory domain-containing protein [Chitinophagaceae bacterium]